VHRLGLTTLLSALLTVAALAGCDHLAQESVSTLAE
jgi:hypothetical protein